MASLVTGIYDLAAGDPAAAEQKKFGSLGDFDTGTGEALTTAGAGYDLDILSGDPTKIAQVEAPEISAQQGQIEQQRLQNANFNTRSGGTAASTSAAEAGGRANIIDLTGGLQKSTADAASSTGGNLLTQATSNIGNEAQLAEERRSQVNSDVGGIATGAAEIATGFIDPAAAAPSAVSDPDIAASKNDWGQGPTPPSLGFDPNELDPNAGHPDLSAFQ